jgi:hypothetical protein
MVGVVTVMGDKKFPRLSRANGKRAPAFLSGLCAGIVLDGPRGVETGRCVPPDGSD